MLEAFFNNEKTFSIFKFLLTAEGYVSIIDIHRAFEMPVYDIHKILNNFDLLDMIEYDSPKFIRLDLDNPIVLSICILDELLEKYYLDNERERIMENGDFQQIIGDTDIMSMSVLDFVECLKKIKN